MRIKTISLLFCAILLVGCASVERPRQIYYWDASYAKAIYDYMDMQGDSYAQIAELENLAQKAYEKGLKTPPGVFAHLGLLYSNQGNAVQSEIYFKKEIENFPESRAYIEFLLKQAKMKKAKK